MRTRIVLLAVALALLGAGQARADLLIYSFSATSAAGDVLNGELRYLHNVGDLDGRGELRIGDNPANRSSAASQTRVHPAGTAHPHLGPNGGYSIDAPTLILPRGSLPRASISLSSKTPVLST